MARFQYTAMDSNGKERKGAVEADNEQEATQQLKQMGLFPTSLVLNKAPPLPRAQAGQRRRKPPASGSAPKISRKDLTTTRQLATLLEAGLPGCGRCGRWSAGEGNKPALNKVLGDLATSPKAAPPSRSPGCSPKIIQQTLRQHGARRRGLQRHGSRPRPPG